MHKTPTDRRDSGAAGRTERKPGGKPPAETPAGLLHAAAAMLHAGSDSPVWRGWLSPSKTNFSRPYLAALYLDGRMVIFDAHDNQIAVGALRVWSA